MSDPTMQPSAPRPRPILLAQSILAALALVTGTAGFSQHVPAAAAWWIITGLAAVNLGLGFYLQSRTTPLSSPQDARGVPLVPIDAIDPPLQPPAPPAAGTLPTTSGAPVRPE